MPQKSSAACLYLALAIGLVRGQNDTDSPAPTWPQPKDDYYTISNFTLDSGGTLEELDIHYQTFGTLKVFDSGKTNAVFLMHGSTGQAGQFAIPEFVGELFNTGQVIDVEKYFVIIRDGIGHGNTTNPRDSGLRQSFPSSQYSDMIRADHMLLTEHLNITHLRLVMGVSMGGMQTWLWGEEYPNFMDALFPIASQPVQIAGHNQFWRKILFESLLCEPAFNGGDYETQPIASLRATLGLELVMFQGLESMQRDFPTRDAVDGFLEALLEQAEAEIDFFDANNRLYAYNSSYTYNPAPKLRMIKAQLTAVNTEDDLMNPSKLGTLQRAVNELMVPGVGKAVIVPTSNATRGHASYIKAALWKDELELLLCRSGTSTGM